MPLDILDRRHYTRVLRPPADAETLPPWCYTDPAFFAAETDRVFRHGWIGIGRADRVANPGDYATFTLAGVPVILLRDRKGVLRAFANSCRHRGATLLEGAGNCRAIQCPFHAWTYALDGRLIGAPRMENCAGFDRADNGLVTIRLETRDGFAFLCFDDEAPDLDDWLGDFSQMHAPWRLDDMVTARRREFAVGCNWKLFLEVFNEYYHLPAVHPGTIGGIYETPDAPDPVSGQYVTQFGTHEGRSGLLSESQDAALPPIGSLRGRNRDGTRYTLAFPNLTFAASNDSMWVYEVYPTAPDRTRVGMTVAFPRAASELPDFAERSAAYCERVDAAIAEDIAVLERQQAGLTSPLARPGRLSDLEPNVAAFGAWIADRVAG